MKHLFERNGMYKGYEIVDTNTVKVSRGIHGKEETEQAVYLNRDELVLLISEIDRDNLESEE